MTNERPLGEIIKKFATRYNLDSKLQEVRLKDSWEKLMGKTIAKHTTKLYLSNKKLYVNFDSAPLREELLFAKDKVIKMINKELGEEVVEDIIIR
ncbi:MAG: DUF721 domain-containing protein [Bacteroidota bacterium]